MATLKGVFPDPNPVRRKNFIQENVRNLRRMEQYFHPNDQKLQLQRHSKVDKYSNVSARINTTFHENKLPSDPTVNIASCDNEKQMKESKSKKQYQLNDTIVSVKANSLSLRQKRLGHTDLRKSKDLHKRIPSDSNIVSKQHVNAVQKYKNQGIQTIDNTDIDNIYAEGTIRYPTKNKINLVQTIKMDSDRQEKNCSSKIHNPTDHGDVLALENPINISKAESPGPSETVDFIKLNKQRISNINKNTVQQTSGKLLPNHRKGTVPKYILDRKEEQQKRQEQTIPIDANCPEGHIALPETERKETLIVLKKNYQDYVTELNKMPIRSDTLRVQQKRIEIEKQLNKLEEAIKVFTRPKVYIKIDE
ncbi:uncharacterized protein [Prorops nasuta]|uniref:uncharacterized protein n=1 Tax=Prorops nasuta TaxID=863751 RepID=UPI0034CD9026